MKKLFIACVVLVLAVIGWLKLSHRTTDVPTAVDVTSTTQAIASEAIATSAATVATATTPVPTALPAGSASEAVIADQAVFDTKSDPNLQPIDPDTDPANQSVAAK